MLVQIFYVNYIKVLTNGCEQRFHCIGKLQTNVATMVVAETPKTLMLKSKHTVMDLFFKTLINVFSVVVKFLWCCRLNLVWVLMLRIHDRQLNLWFLYWIKQRVLFLGNFGQRHPLELGCVLFLFIFCIHIRLDIWNYLYANAGNCRFEGFGRRCFWQDIASGKRCLLHLVSCWILLAYSSHTRHFKLMLLLWFLNIRSGICLSKEAL